MPRPRSHTRDSLIESAMHHFWHYGYGRTSMDDLVRSTGVNRHGIYNDVGGKHELYIEGFTAYQDTVVTPAFAGVEVQRAGLRQIEAYFNGQISLAEAMGLPGPGCHIANAMTETAPHDPQVAEVVSEHNDRLTAGFYNALADLRVRDAQRQSLAEFLTISAQGLWSLSRVVDDAETLRAHVHSLMKLIKSAR